METKELWKPIVGYEGLYIVSNFGRVRSLDRVTTQKANGGINYLHNYKGRILKPLLCQGYHYVCLAKDGHITNALIHRLVASAFIPNPNNLPQVNHKDENKLNNYVENLEWCSPVYNTTYGTRIQRLIDKRVRKVAMLDEDNKVIKVFDSLIQAEREHGISHSNISAVCHGRKKRAGGFKWSYVYVNTQE